jgi:DNA-binding transcriptional LysR family regulator
LHRFADYRALIESGQYFLVLSAMPFGYSSRMELRHLRYFVGVADELSFTRAAKTLRVAQPALSRQIRQLEEELGVRLFDRNGRGVRLTGAGEVFLKEARSLLAHSANAVRAAQATGKAVHESLNIGYVWGLFHSLVPAVVARFRRDFPNIAVNLFDLTATQQAAALAEGRLDAGFIGFAEEADAAGLSKRKVGECAFVAALPKNHPSARRRTVALSALSQDFFFVISEEHYPGAAHWVRKACQQAGFRPRVLQSAGRGHTILSLVAGNCGVAVLPEPLQALPHPGVVFRPLKDSTRSDLFVAWRAKPASAVRDSFLETALKSK